LVGNTSNETFRCLLRRHIEKIREGSNATVDETSVSEVVATESPGENRANTEPVDTVASEPVITEPCETESADALDQRKAHAELPRDGSSIHAAFAGYKGGVTVEYVRLCNVSRDLEAMKDSTRLRTVARLTRCVTRPSLAIVVADVFSLQTRTRLSRSCTTLRSLLKTTIYVRCRTPLMMSMISGTSLMVAGSTICTICRRL
jgi:hypothetical protein